MHSSEKDRRMPRQFISRIDVAILLFALLLIASASQASDVEDLTEAVQDFLAGVTNPATHDRFWADDLIYTSSRGTRTTKADIMAGFSADPVADSASNSNDSGPTYSAEDMQIQIYGDTAVVAFRLVAAPTDSSEQQEYLNTGTFVRRDDRWQAVAWQATIIPGTIIPAE